MVALFLLSAPIPVLAQDGWSCLERQLTELDIDVKTPSRRADAISSRYDTSMLPKLSNQTALLWCRMIGIATPELQVFWPAQAGDVVSTKGTASVERAAILNEAVNLMRQRFSEDWGSPLVGRVAVIGGGSQKELNDLYADALVGLNQPVTGRLQTERFCGRRHAGAFAGRGVIGFCWPRSGGEVTLGGILPVMAHELMHQAQFELAADIPQRQLPDGSDALLGPGWMIEGSAEVIELQSMGIAPDVTGTEFFNLQNAARRSRLTLNDLMPSNSVVDREHYGVARFAALLLARKHGLQSLFDYFAHLGRTADRDLAFQAAFGQSFDEFEAEFETLRRDFGAAQAYGGN